MKVVVYGSGGHGKVLADAAELRGLEVLGFIDDDLSRKGAKVIDFPVLGGVEALSGLSPREVEVVVAVGNNAARRALAAKVAKLGFRVASVVHPSAVVSRSARLGTGVQLLAQCVVGPGTRVGDGVVVNTGALVDHDCVLGAYCQVYPGAHLAGTVTVGEEAYVGTGASVIPGKRIGDRATVGAGAVVVDDIPEGVVAKGVPARVSRKV